jgi:hypothetical protein
LDEAKAAMDRRLAQFQTDLETFARSV